MEQRSRSLIDSMVAVLAVARIQIAQEADQMGLNRRIGARVVDLAGEDKSRHLMARTYASDQHAMRFDIFLRIRMVDHQCCQGDYPSET